LQKGLIRGGRFFAPEGEPPLSDKVTVKDIESYRNGWIARPARQPAVSRPVPAPLEEKNKLISDIYYGIHGFGSIAQTVRQVNEYIKSNNINIQKITAEDVKTWKQGELTPKSKPGGYNSFIPDAYGVEVQIDLFYMEDLKNVKDKTFKGLSKGDDEERLRGNVNALLMVEIFSKYTWVVHITSKGSATIIEALKVCFAGMPHDTYPKYVYSDMEGAFISKEVQSFFAGHNVVHLLSLNHAPYAERQIRTIKMMLYDRMSHDHKRGFTGMVWQDYLEQVLTTFNQKMISNVTKMTPAEAALPETHDRVLANLEKTRRTKRLDPPLKVGDEVKIYKKKKIFDKERIPVWSENKHRVTEVVEYQMKFPTADGHQPSMTTQKFYKVSGQAYSLQRSQILLVRSV